MKRIAFIGMLLSIPFLSFAQNVPEPKPTECDSIAQAERAYRKDIARKAEKGIVELQSNLRTANIRIVGLTDKLNNANGENAQLRAENKGLKVENVALKKSQPKQPTRVGKFLRQARDGLAVVGATAIGLAVTLIIIK